jgi:hypothetical protein
MKRLSLVLAALLAACGSNAEPNVSLRIEADPDWLLSENGTRPSSVLRAFLVEDGVRTRVQPTRWIVSDPRVGTIDAEGRFIATGARGGEVMLAAELDRQGASTLRAETPMAVRVRRDVLASPGLSGAVITAFQAATPVDDPSTAPFVRHPLDGARMPNDVAPPSIQWDSDWDSGGQQDLIRVTLDSRFAEVRAYLDGGQIDAAWTVDDASWRLLAESAGGREIELEVARLGRGNTVAPSARVRFSLSARALQLAMVAWELSIDPQRSQLVHVDPTSGERTSMVDLGAIECTGCHAVAIDDDQLAATIDRRFTGVFDLTTGNGMLEIEPPLDGVAFQPGGSLLVGSRIPEGETTSALYAYDRASGDAMTVPGLPTQAGSPSWARDGRWLAYVTGGSDRGTRGRTSIVQAPFTTDRFGTPVTLHDGADLASAPEGGETDSHPSYSPDGSFVAFAHGTASHAADDAATPARSALYLVRAEGGEPVRLERAMGPEGDGLAFWPVMAPRLTIEADGTRHYWLAFYSRMPYGNAVAGTRGTPRRQLWVAAIDPDREGDPSFAPFRVGGQREDRDQLAGAWQVQACVAEGASCRLDSQCCSGVCSDDGTCGEPLACRPLGASCDASSPCCGGLECEAGQCLEVIE